MSHVALLLGKKLAMDGDWTVWPKKKPLVGGMYELDGRRKSGMDVSEAPASDRGSAPRAGIAKAPWVVDLRVDWI
jgi:hypothetical protein